MGHPPIAFGRKSSGRCTVEFVRLWSESGARLFLTGLHAKCPRFAGLCGGANVTGYTISNGRLLLANGSLEFANLDIEDGRIDSIGNRRQSKVALDATGLLVLPGIVDVHGDAFERSLMPRPGVSFDYEIALRETDRILVSHGITTAYLGLTVSWEPGLRSLAMGQAMVDAVDALHDRLACDVRLHIRWETFALDAVETVSRWLASQRKPILGFNDHTTQTMGNLTDTKKLQKWAERSGLQQSEYRELAERIALRAGEVPDGIAMLAARCRDLGVTTLSHDDRTLAEREFYRNLGAGIAEFPLTRAVIEDSRQRQEPTVLGAPNVMRGGSHIGALSATEMVEADLCTVLASDYYYPSMLAAPFRLARDLSRPVHELWPLVSTNAAAAAGLDDRGVLEPGRRADVILVDTSSEVPEVVASFAGGRLVHLGRDILR